MRSCRTAPLDAAALLDHAGQVQFGFSDFPFQGRRASRARL
jgi:hypothetical protein